MVEPIKIEIEFDGGDAAARSIDEVGESLEQMHQRQQAASLKAIEFTTKLQSATSAVQTITTALGSQSRAAGLISAIAGNTSAMAQLGGMFGPQGAFVGGIVGAAIPALQALIGAQEAAAAAAREHVEALRAVAQQAIETRRVESQQRDIRAGTIGADLDANQLAREAEVRRREITRLEERAQELAGNMAGGLFDTLSRARITQLRGEIDEIDHEIRRREADARALGTDVRNPYGLDSTLRGALARAPSAPARRERRGGGGESRIEREQAAWDRYNEAVRRGLEQQEAARQRLIEAQERQIELMIEEADKARDLANARVEAELEAKHAIESAEAERARREQEAIEERVRAQEQADEDLMRANERALDAAREQVAGYKEATDVIVGGLTDALASIIDGSKTAEQAFLGLLAGFLKFIAEKAALSAAEEAAQAIAAYARYDYASGAQHTAAAVAYGAVAIAAGAGSAAASSAASSAGRAAEPERGRSQGSGGGSGGGVVVNINSPIVSAGTRAELGRELQQTIEAGRARYG